MMFSPQNRRLLLRFFQLVPDWALHCTENPEITVQYISDSGAVQLSRHCQDTVKEISCQQKMSSIEMYDELRCPEEQTTITTDASTFFEVSSSTTEESRPEVIIKNPQKMLEDVFSNIEVNIEVDSNRLDLADAKKDLDLMVGDQPIVDTSEDKKTLLKLPEKKEIFIKKSKNAKKESKTKEAAAVVEDGEMMMGDAPAVDENGHLTTVPSKPESSTTDRQRRVASETTLAVSTEAASSTNDDASEEPSTIAVDLTTETQQITTVVTEEPTTKIIVQGHPLFHSQNVQKDPTADVDRKDVQGHPLFHSQVVFKEPIPVDTGNGTLERKDVGNVDDHFIPPMLLVKARFTATKSTEGTEETKEMTTDEATSAVTEATVDSQTVTESDDKNVTAKPTESNEISTNEISSVTQLETTLMSEKTEKPIKVEKRNDPRLGLHTITATSQSVSSTVAAQETTTEAQSPSSTTEELTTTEEEVSSSSVTYESSISDISTAEARTEFSEVSEASSLEASTSVQPEVTAEKIIESTTHESETSPPSPSTVDSISVTPIAIKLTTLRSPEISSPKLISKSTTPMRNDIDARPHDESHEISHELHDNSDENESFEHHQHIENTLNNEENYQPYKPNRHRTISKLDHHHGPGFSIGKILGK